eukprot:gene16785-5163_t
MEQSKGNELKAATQDPRTAAGYSMGVTPLDPRTGNSASAAEPAGEPAFDAIEELRKLREAKAMKSLKWCCCKVPGISMLVQEQKKQEDSAVAGLSRLMKRADDTFSNTLVEQNVTVADTQDVG